MLPRSFSVRCGRSSHKKAAAMCPPGSPHWAAQCDAESSSRGRRYLNLHATISGHRFRKRPASTVARPQRSTRHKSRQTRRKTARTAVYQTPRGLANIGRQRGKGLCRRSFEGPRRRFVPTPRGRHRWTLLAWLDGGRLRRLKRIATSHAEPESEHECRRRSTSSDGGICCGGTSWRKRSSSHRTHCQDLSGRALCRSNTCDRRCRTAASGWSTALPPASKSTAPGGRVRRCGR